MTGADGFCENGRPAAPASHCSVCFADVQWLLICNAFECHRHERNCSWCEFSGHGEQVDCLGCKFSRRPEQHVSVGAPGAERQITNVADGTASTDAVNVRQLNSTANWVRDDMQKYRRDANAGSASAIAMANLPQAVLPERRS